MRSDAATDGEHCGHRQRRHRSIGRRWSTVSANLHGGRGNRRRRWSRHAAAIAEQLAQVREERHYVSNGTGPPTAFVGLLVSVAGKTGTPEAPLGLPYAWFVGCRRAVHDGPICRVVEAPELAIAVILRTPARVQTAAPLSGIYIWIYYGIEPTPFPWAANLRARSSIRPHRAACQPAVIDRVLLRANLSTRQVLRFPPRQTATHFIL